MGKLRKEPKVKTLDTQKYKEILGILKQAQSLSEDSHVFWDLDKGEDAAQVRKDFQYVAQKEDVPLKIRRLRKKATLQLLFNNTESVQRRKRISAEEARERILRTLSQAREPMKKSDILHATGISNSTWNLRIKELLDNNEVKKEGDKANTVYMTA